MANSAKIGGLNIDLTELSADTSPQLGGNLDLNSNNITGTGNVNTTGTITSSGAITSSGTITGNTFSGSGASLTNLNASNLASGTIPDARFPSALPAVDGSNLTGINTDLVSDTTPQLGGDLASNGNNINIADNDRINLGASNDLQIYHNGSHSFVRDQGVGHFYVTTNGDFIHLGNGSTLQSGKFSPAGSVELAHNGSKKFETTSTGAAITGNLTTTGTITPGTYKPGEIIETIACMCDGSTVSVQSGDYTITNVSGAQSSTSSYVVMTGSEIDYTPPTGAKRVLYRYNFKFDVTSYSGISHFKFQIDGTDVVPASRNYASNYASTNWHHANLELGIEWVIDCDAASDDAANGKFTSWTSAKTLRGVHRHYGGGYSHRLHGNVWWDGTSASGGYNNPIKPFLYIQAIA